MSEELFKTDLWIVYESIQSDFYVKDSKQFSWKT